MPPSRMASLTMISAAGRIAPKPFALGAMAVYFASFLSQFLLAAPITARASIIPFVLVQVAIGWAWYALHVGRLRDAGRPTGAAVALTVLYALAIVLLLLVMIAANAPGGPNGGDDTPFARVFQIFLPLFLIGTVLADPNLGMFGYMILGVLALVMLPIVIAIIFTIWAGTRPRAPVPP